MSYASIDEIREANAQATRDGGYWFSDGAMAFFNSIVYPDIYHGRYFITSESYDGSDAARAYSIRRANDDGTIDTVGEFQDYETREDAILAVGRMDA
jgi:hypothetical protein